MFGIYEKLINLKKSISSIQRAINILREISPNLILFEVIYGFLESIKPYIPIYFSALIIDELMSNRNPDVLLKYIISSIFVYLILGIISDYFGSMIKVKEKILMESHEIYLNRFSYKMDYDQLENAEVTEQREKILGIMEAQEGGLVAIPPYICDITKNIFLIIIAFLISYKIFMPVSNDKLLNNWASLPVLIIFITIIILCVVLIIRNSKIQWNRSFDISMKGAEYNRYISYYLEEYLDDNKYAKDIRIFNQQEVVTNEMEKNGFWAWTNVFKECENVERKYGGMNVIIFSLITGIVYIFVWLRALVGVISIGDVIKHCVSISQMFLAFSNLSTTLTALSSNNMYLDMLYNYIDIPLKNNNKGKKIINDNKNNEYIFEFHNVSFKYPGSDKYALKELSMKFGLKEKLAIVGKNGSGKTTMVKLLCRLYEPTDGYITLNGVKISEYDYQDYANLFSVVFQDFKLFSLPVGQNVANNIIYDMDKVWDSLYKSGIKYRVEEFHAKLNTSLYKQFETNGVEISGGEEQKIAIARALYRDSPIFILDEPTASLDPESEYEIYSKMNEISKDKAVIFISHRLSSCCFSDRIAVFDNGKLVQLGTHKLLLNDKNGSYYKLWDAQAQYYYDANNYFNFENV